MVALNGITAIHHEQYGKKCDNIMSYFAKQKHSWSTDLIKRQ